MKVTRESNLKALPFPPGLSLESTDTVRKYHYVDVARSWFEAQAHCREEYVDLATVTDREESDRLLRALQSGGADAWIGLLDDLAKWTWTTQNMSFNNDKHYSNWEMEKLNHSSSRNKCALMKTSGAWLDLPCQEQHLSVCYDGKRATDQRIRLKATNLVSESVSCGLSLVNVSVGLQTVPAHRSSVCRLENHPDTYILLNESMKWGDALKSCRADHTDLVIVRNGSENERVASLLPADAWMGLFRWSWKRWSDHSGVGFSNWEKVQPDTLKRMVESCALADADTAMWRGDNCHLRRPFICYSVQKTWEVRVTLKVLSEADLQEPAANQKILEQVK